MFILKAQPARLEYVAFSADGDHLAVCGWRGPLHLWSLSARNLAHKIASAPIVRAISFTPDGRDLLALIDHKGLCRFDPSSGQRLGTAGIGEAPYGATFSPDGGQVCLCSWDPRGWQLLRQFRLPGGQAGWTADVPGAIGPVALAYSPGGHLVALGKSSGSVHLFDAASGAHRGQCGSDRGPGVRSVALSPDDRLVAWSAAGHLRLWRLDPPEEVAAHDIGRTHFFAVKFHPSGEFLATAKGDGKVDNWDGRTGEHRSALDWGVGQVRALAFDASGDRAACCGQGGETVVWDVD
jgi:WD40 repeat protein